MNAAKENTFRALRDEELLVTSFLCRFNWHTWTKYREPEIIRDSTFKPVTIQERRCGSCNLSNRKILSKD